MRAVSKRRAVALRVYRRRRDLFLEANPACAICRQRAEEVHHMAGRGSALLDESRWLPLCHEDHRFVTEHPAIAIERGWSLPRVGVSA